MPLNYILCGMVGIFNHVQEVPTKGSNHVQEVPTKWSNHVQEVPTKKIFHLLCFFRTHEIA